MSLIGLRLNPISGEDAVSLVGQAIHNRKRCIIANHNLHSINLWHRDPLMRQFYSLADYIHIDGMFLILLANMLGMPLNRANRTTSLDFFPLLAIKAVKEDWRIFYLGSKPGVAARAATILQARYPGLQIRTHHGHFDAEMSGEANQKVLAEINAYAPHVLFVGMGMPRQEVWILDNHKALAVNAIFPAGAFMDYMAGEIPTAPRWLASFYLEWLFRLFSEPRRLWRRYLVEPWFVFGQIAKYCLKSGRPFEIDKEHLHE